jgi:hypothetical protein
LISSSVFAARLTFLASEDDFISKTILSQCWVSFAGQTADAEGGVEVNNSLNSPWDKVIFRIALAEQHQTLQ